MVNKSRMSKLNLQIKELDRIGQTMLDAARLKKFEIDRIAAAPQLFSNVIAKIEAEQRARQTKKLINISGFFHFQPRLMISATAILIIFIGGVIGWSQFGKVNQTVKTAHNSTLEIQKAKQSNEQLPIVLPEISNESPKIIKTSLVPAPTKTNRVKTATVKFSKVSPPKSRREQPQQKLNREIKETEGEFYAVGFTGNAVESTEEMHIVRAELTRSSLFALGVNLSLENETEKIKTDLLVGADGVARAIRLVN